VLDAPLSHIFSDAGRDEGLVNTTVAVGCNGNLGPLVKKIQAADEKKKDVPLIYSLAKSYPHWKYKAKHPAQKT
jgi:hypothetical protein